MEHTFRELSMKILRDQPIETFLQHSVSSRRGFDVNFVHPSENVTLLMIAAHKDTPAAIIAMETLLNFGADVDAKNKTNQTAVSYTIPYHPRNFWYLVEKGADFRIKDFLGRNEFMLILLSGNIEFIKNYLNKIEYSINKQDNLGNTALILATFELPNETTQSEKMDIIKILLEVGADPNIPNFSRQTPLKKACEQNDVKLIVELIEYGAGYEDYTVGKCFDRNGIDPDAILLAKKERDEAVERVAEEERKNERKLQIEKMQQIQLRLKRSAEEADDTSSKKVKTGKPCEIYQEKCELTPILGSDWCDPDIPNDNLFNFNNFKECFDIKEIMDSIESGFNRQVFGEYKPEYPSNPFNRRAFSLLEITQLIEYATFIAKLDMEMFPVTILFLELLANGVLDCKKYNGTGFYRLANNGSFILTDDALEFRKHVIKKFPLSMMV